MTSRTTRTAAALTGALALASGAYAIGSRVDDGNAVAAAGASNGAAATQTVHFRGPGGGGARGFESLADRLGVSESKLRAALDDLRPRADARKDVAKLLAGELGIERSRVEQAFETRREQHEAEHAKRRAAFAADLAKALGIDAGKVEKVLADNAPDRGRGPGRGMKRPPSLSALAKDLGVSRAKLREALRDVRPSGAPGPHRETRPFRGGPGGPHGPGPGGPGGPFGADSADLAKALGVSEARLEDAFDAIHDRLEQEMEARHDEFVTKLAERLGVSKAKVEDALPAPGPGHHGPGGP